MPIRLMASLLYFKHAYGESDESVCERWAENVVWQFFGGMTYCEPRLPCDATQVGRFRRVLGEASVEELLAKTIETAVAIEAIEAITPTEFAQLLVAPRCRRRRSPIRPTAACSQWRGPASSVRRLRRSIQDLPDNPGSAGRQGRSQTEGQSGGRDAHSRRRPGSHLRVAGSVRSRHLRIDAYGCATRQ